MSETIQSTTMFEHLPGLLFRCVNEPKWTMVYLSNSCEKITGYHQNELINNNELSFQSIIHPFDHAFVWDTIQTAVKISNSYSIEYRLVKKDKSIIWVLEQGYGVFDEQDNLSYIEGYIADITSERILTRTFNQNEKYFQALYNKSPIPFQSLDINGNIILINQAWLNELGYTRKDVIGTWFGDYLTDEEKEKFNQTFSSFKQKGEISNIQFSLKKKNGDFIRVNYNGKILSNEKDEFEKTHCVFTNITEKEKKEKKLEEYADLLKLAQSIAHLGSWKWNLYTDKIEWSDEIEQIFGFDNHELNYDILTILKKIVHPEDKKIALDAYYSFLENKEIKLLEIRIIRPNGEIRNIWAEVGIKKVDQNGKLIEVVGTVQDITKNKEMLHELELKNAALNSAGNSIVITDSNAMIEWVNPAFEKLTGYSASEAIGNNPKKILKSGKTNPDVYTDMWNTVKQGEIWRGIFINRRKDGSLYEEHQVINPIKNDSGNITHFVAIKEDISESKRTEKLLKLKTVLQETLINFGNRLNQINSITQLVEEFNSIITNRINCSKINLYLLNHYNMFFEKVDIYPILYKGTELISNDDAEYASILKILNDIKIVKVNEGEQISKMLIPLYGEGLSIGVIEYSIQNMDELQSEVLNWLEIMTNQTILAYLSIKNNRKIKKRNAQLLGLREVDAAINALKPLEEISKLIINQIKTFLGVDAADILFYNEENNHMKYFHGYGFDTIDPATHYHKIDVGLPGLVVKNKTFIDYDFSIEDEKNKELCCDKFKKEKFVRYLGLPIIVENEVIGVLELFNRSPLNSDTEWYQYLFLIAGQMEIAIKHHNLFNHLQRANQKITESYDITIEGWSKAMDLRDHETEGHTQRVMALTAQFARELGLSESEIDTIRRGSLLHDIGKIGIPDRILHKPGKLDAEEWKIMKKHPQYAYDILKNSEFLVPALDIPYCHHERWDGTGYPRGLKGEEIPLNARLFMLVDVYDAMVSDRPYRKAMDPNDVLNYIMSQKGKMFDPSLTDQFVALIKTIKFKISRILLF